MMQVYMYLLSEPQSEGYLPYTRLPILFITYDFGSLNIRVLQQ